MLSAVFFGGIGALAETSELQRAAFNSAFREHSLDWSWDQDTYRALLDQPGGVARITAYAAARGLALPPEVATQVHASKSRWFRKHLDAGIAARPGVAELVQAASDEGVALAIASTTSLTVIDAVLTAAGIAADQFALIAHRSLVQNPKPSGEVFRLCLDRLQIAASHALAVEDSDSGLAAARAAGVRCLVTPGANTRQQRFAGAVAVAEDLAQFGTPSLSGLRDLLRRETAPAE